MINFFNVILYSLSYRLDSLELLYIIYMPLQLLNKKKYKRTRKESLPSNFAHENCDFRDRNLRHGENGDRGRSPRSFVGKKIFLIMDHVVF